MESTQHQSERKLITMAILIIVVYLSPLFILGENAHIRIHDNLDSNLAWYKVLANSGEISGSVDASIAQIMNGHLSRNAFSSEFSLIVWLYALFPTMVAYGVSQAITRFAAFFGMYLLLKKHFIPSEEMSVIRVGVALAFSLTLFWPSGMLSTLGMPLALWAFLNIRNGESSWKNYAALLLLPFYSSIVLGFFFFLSAMGMLWFVDFVRGRGWNFHFLSSIVLMSVMYLIVEYRLVYSFLFMTDPTSRDEYFHARLPFWRSVLLSIKNFVLGHHHVMTAHTFIMLPVIFLALDIILIHKLWKREKMFLLLFWVNVFLSIWYAFWFYKGWLPLTERFHFLDTFNFARYHFLRPLVIYVLFAISLKILWKKGGKWKRNAKILLYAQIIFLFLINEEIVFYKNPSVREFYAEKQFQEIKDYIGLPVEKYRVASIGMHPAIPQYNGFYTLDSYNNFYPLSYKNQFRKIIEKELAKNASITTYFDEWGARCYIFTNELGKNYMFTKDRQKPIKNLQLNIEQFKKMGGSYIFSAVQIENAGDNQLHLESVFQSQDTPWKIYLYKAL